MLTGPCETEIGIAEKVDNGLFENLPSSNQLLQNINDPDYINYAPYISSDDLELYFNRYWKEEITSALVVEICASVRSSSTDQFGSPRFYFQHQHLK